MKFETYEEAFKFVETNNIPLPYQCKVLSTTRPNLYFDAEITKNGLGMCLSAREPKKLHKQLTQLEVV